MADTPPAVRLDPPGAFDFKDPDSWPRWKKRFEQFRVASGLSTAEPVRQVSTLLYCLGEEAESVLSAIGITAAQRAVYTTVTDKFDAYFRIRRNVIFERARFNRRNQQDGESVEQYIMEIHRLADNCDYGNLKEDLIRDRLVVGIKDSRLSQ